MLLLTLFATILPAALAVKCYICSWSPNDAPNRTDICSDEHFEAKFAAIHDCESGCEIYTHVDKNGVIEQVRRNCLQPTTELTGDCKTSDTIAYTAKRCTCDSDFCNSASLFHCSYLMLAFLFLCCISHFLYQI